VVHPELLLTRSRFFGDSGFGSRSRRLFLNDERYGERIPNYFFILEAMKDLSIQPFRENFQRFKKCFFLVDPNSVSKPA
jgi:hypothetical protein